MGTNGRLYLTSLSVFTSCKLSLTFHEWDRHTCPETSSFPTNKYIHSFPQCPRNIFPFLTVSVWKRGAYICCVYVVSIKCKNYHFPSEKFEVLGRGLSTVSGNSGWDLKPESAQVSGFHLTVSHKQFFAIPLWLSCDQPYPWREATAKAVSGEVFHENKQNRNGKTWCLCYKYEL